MKQFHTYGDSHSSEHGSWTMINLENIKIVTNWLGPKLMYSFGRDKDIIIKKEQINDGDYICFCFGEIDCRAHVYRYETSWRQTIDNLVVEYFLAISKNVSGLNVKTCVYNAVPQVDRRKTENQWMTEWDINNSHDKNYLPAIGTDEDRRKYTLYMNEKLKEFCGIYGYIFFDIYDKYVDDEGFLNPVYSDGNCHIKDPIFIIEKLQNL